MVEAGHASPRLLLRPTIAQKLSALKIAGAIETLVKEPYVASN